MLCLTLRGLSSIKSAIGVFKKNHWSHLQASWCLPQSCVWQEPPTLIHLLPHYLLLLASPLLFPEWWWRLDIWCFYLPEVHLSPFSSNPQNAGKHVGKRAHFKTETWLSQASLANSGQRGSGTWAFLCLDGWSFPWATSFMKAFWIPSWNWSFLPLNFHIAFSPSQTPDLLAPATILCFVLGVFICVCVFYALLGWEPLLPCGPSHVHLGFLQRVWSLCLRHASWLRWLPWTDGRLVIYQHIIVRKLVEFIDFMWLEGLTLRKKAHIRERH